MKENYTTLRSRLGGMDIGESLFPVYYDFIHYYKDYMPAMVLSFILYRTKKRIKLHDRGVFISAKDFEEELFLSKDRVNRILKILEEDGVIERRMVKIYDSPKRWISINKEKIKDILKTN